MHILLPDTVISPWDSVRRFFVTLPTEKEHDKLLFDIFVILRMQYGPGILNEDEEWVFWGQSPTAPPSNILAAPEQLAVEWAQVPSVKTRLKELFGIQGTKKNPVLVRKYPCDEISVMTHETLQKLFQKYDLDIEIQSPYPQLESRAQRLQDLAAEYHKLDAEILEADAGVPQDSPVRHQSARAK